MLLNLKKRLVSDAIQAALEICLGEWIGGETVLIFALREFNSPQLLRKPRKYLLKFMKKSGPKNPEKVRYPAGFPAGYLFGQLNLVRVVRLERTVSWSQRNPKYFFIRKVAIFSSFYSENDTF